VNYVKTNINVCSHSNLQIRPGYKKYFLFLLLLFFLITAKSLFAQTITIKDFTTNQPLEIVTIYSEDLQRSALSDAKGNADISLLKNAEKIRFQLLGYENIVKSYKQLEENNFIVLMKPSSISIDEVVISASKWDESKKDIPQKIAVVRPADIFFQNPQTAADMLGTTGQVFIQKSQPGGGSPMIRGFAANRVLIVVDGVRMNNAIFRAGNLQNIISIDPFTLERAEVVFGPGSVIYGSDAIGGVIDFITLSPKLSSSDIIYYNINAAVRFSSANQENTGHFDINTGFKNWGLVTSLTYTTFGDLKMGSSGPDEYKRLEYAEIINGIDSTVVNPDPLVQIPGGYDQINFMQKIRFTPDINWDINYGFHYSATSDYPRYDRLLEYRNGNLRSAVWYYGPQKWIMHNLNIRNFSSNILYDKASFLFAYQKFEESRHDRTFNRTAFNHQREIVDVFSFNFDFSKELNKEQKLFYGAEALLNKVNSTSESEDISTGTIKPIGTRYPDGSASNSFAAYLNYKNELTEKLTFKFSTRYTYITLDAEFDTTFYPFPFTEANLNTGAVNGSAGLTYRPQEEWQFNFNLSTGFRAPNIDDVGKVFESEPGAVVVPNPNLKPEYAYSLETGITKRFENIAKLDITAFYTLLDDALVRRPFMLNGRDSILYDGENSQVLAIQNAAEAYAWGIEAGLEIQLPEGFSISSKLNFQNGEEQDEETGKYIPLRHAAPLFFTSHLNYIRERFKADLYFIYCGEISYADLAPSERSKPHIYAIDENGNPYSPDWYTLNFKAGYQLTDYLQINAGIENIADQRYRPYSSGLTAAGRNFVFSVRTRF
jgi:hemoglobin/transferrin/lactoferrin receptor protein